ncbi:MAG: hypothetical protein HY321_18910 [Armatimonadetes bacterium]|nr:hypothetical protein [Armatimonadota bacterium]
MDPSRWPQRKRMRLEGADYSDPGHVYFATLCARADGAPFACAPLAGEVVAAIDWSRQQGRWRVYSYCLMPDHLHLAVSPGAAGLSLSHGVPRLQVVDSAAVLGSRLSGRSVAA